MAIIGRRPLVGSKLKYMHETEHRGHGTVAIYSYGPCGEHEALVREAKSLMRQRFGVTGAVSSGGISGWPHDEHEREADYNRRTVETQTIFCIHAVAGRNRPKLKACPSAKADWHLIYDVNGGRAYAYFTGPLEDEAVWREFLSEHFGETVTYARVEAVPDGLYWFLADSSPVAEWEI